MRIVPPYIHSTAAGCFQIFTKNVHILIPDFIPTVAPAPLPVPAVKTTTSPPLLQTQQLIQSFIPDLNPVHFSTIPLNPLRADDCNSAQHPQ